MPGKEERQEASACCSDLPVLGHLAQGGEWGTCRGCLKMAQKLPGPSSPLRALHSQRAKDQRGHRKPGMDNGASVVPRASAFLRHERRRPEEGQRVPPHTQREAPYHACPAPRHASPRCRHHQPHPFPAQAHGASEGTHLGTEGYVCPRSLTNTDKCTHATRYVIPTHAKRNTGSCAHSHVQPRPHANVQPGCPLPICLALNALDRRAEGGPPGNSSPAFRLLNQPDIKTDRLRRPPWLNAQSAGRCHLLLHPIQG